jgi:hypothetical protein
VSLLALIPLVGGIIDKVFPDADAAANAKLELMRLAQAGELAQLNAETSLALGQIDTNKVEASTGKAAALWRPGAGWVCVAGMGYTFLAQPLLSWLSAVKGWPVPPEIATDSLMVLLTGMLGLGSFRSYEKAKGVTK